MTFFLNFIDSNGGLMWKGGKVERWKDGKMEWWKDEFAK